MKCKNVHSAIVSYEKSLNLFGDDNRSITVLFSLLDCYLELQNWVKGRESISRLEEFLLDEYQKYISLDIEAEIDLWESKFSRGMRNIKKSLKYFKECGSSNGQLYIFNRLGNFHYLKGDFKKSAEYYRMGRDLI